MPELMPVFMANDVDIFVGEASLYEHACAERADTFVSATQRGVYRLAHTRAKNLERYLDAFTGRDLARLRWSEISDLVRQVAGKKAR